MKRYTLFSVLLVLAVALVWIGCGTEQEPLAPAGQQTVAASKPAGVGAVIVVQNRHTPGLMAISGVVGTATGLTADGRFAVKVLAERPGVAGIPEILEGVPVDVVVTGKILALAPPPGKGPGNGNGGGGGKNKVDPTGRFPRPVPIGVSTGNEGECSSGTIGCRVTDGTNVYALSNNHVYALENNAPIGSNVLQPGRFDTECAIDPNDIIGQLSNFEPIKFDGSDNTLDAAIAISSTTNLGNATPSDGYGTPRSSPVSASVGLNVQKYGRTTGQTRGEITMVNATVKVGYTSGTARFVGQVVVQARKPFIKAGDSGSLLVTDPGRDPVGLLFAGSQDGKLAVANEIGAVLSRFGAAVDGE